MVDNEIKRNLWLALILIFFMIGVSQTIGLSREGFENTDTLSQFFFYSGPGIGFLVGLLIALFLVHKSNYYTKTVFFNSPGVEPSIKLKIFESPLKLFILSFVVFSILGLFAVSSNTVFTGVGGIQQQFTAVDNLIYSSALIPSSENLAMAFFFAFTILVGGYYMKKNNVDLSTYKLTVLFAGPLLFGLFGVANHLLRYGASDVALFTVFIFWAAGGLFTVLSGSFIPFWVAHICNNLFYELTKMFSNESIFVYTIIGIIALTLLYFYLPNKKSENE